MARQTRTTAFIQLTLAAASCPVEAVHPALLRARKGCRDHPRSALAGVSPEILELKARPRSDAATTVRVRAYGLQAWGRPLSGPPTEVCMRISSTIAVVATLISSLVNCGGGNAPPETPEASPTPPQAEAPAADPAPADGQHTMPDGTTMPGDQHDHQQHEK